MKKLIYLPLLLLTLVVGVNKVHAEGTYLPNYYNNYSFYTTFELNYSEQLDYLIDWYNDNYSSTYDYYYIYGSELESQISITIVASKVNEVQALEYPNSLHLALNTNEQINPSMTYIYYKQSGNSNYQTSQYGSIPGGGLLYSSNTIVNFPGTCVNQNYSCSSLITLPSFSDISLDVSFPLTSIESGDTIPTYMSLTNGEPTADFTQVDMSQYEYIILSLKNYYTEPFNTTIYSLGRLCFTPVYNYGMTEVNTLYGSYQTQGCTEYYNTSTPVMIFIIQDDIDNNAVYYIKRYSDETNVLSIPTSIFDITYITSSNVNDPQIEINGRSYPGIPYSQLNDTANKSSEEGYVSGRACALGDVNCYSEAGLDIDIDNIWTKPLDTLKSLWSGITNFFTLVSTFIALLPSPLKEFLITAFMLAIILGIIKIIL